MTNVQVVPLMDDVRTAAFDRDAIVSAHERAVDQGCGTAFLEALLAESEMRGQQVQLAELPDLIQGSVTDSGSGDSITVWLSGIPLVGKRLASARDAMSFIRANPDDPTTVRVVKLVGRGLVIVATGATGYLLVAHDDVG
jgi:hypothetical protein